MLRRTQADILQGHLPPRTDYVVYCALNNAQREEYERAAAEVKRCALFIVFVVWFLCIYATVNSTVHILCGI